VILDFGLKDWSAGVPRAMSANARKFRMHVAVAERRVGSPAAASVHAYFVRVSALRRSRLRSVWDSTAMPRIAAHPGAGDFGFLILD